MSSLQTWVLAGQSNMEGCGLLADAEGRRDSGVLSFTSAGQWEVAEEPLHRHDESFTAINRRIAAMHREDARRRGPADRPAGVEEADASSLGSGLGLAFAREVRARTGEPVGLIPAAHGGTSLEQWSPALADQGADSLYGAMRERILSAGEQRDIHLAGLLWYQGESDANDLPDAATYAARFDAWIAALRADLGAPGLPVHVVQLGRVVQPGSTNHHWWQVIREAQRSVSRRVEATSCVAAHDLPLTDPIHISAEGLARLGRRLARMALGASELQPTALSASRRTPHGLPTLRLACSGVHGGWRVASRVTGFHLYTAGGQRHPRYDIVDVRPDRDDPSGLEVVLSGLDADCRLGYALEPDAAGLLTDEADLALPAFGPWPVGHRTPPGFGGAAA